MASSLRPPSSPGVRRGRVSRADPRLGCAPSRRRTASRSPAPRPARRRCAPVGPRRSRVRRVAPLELPVHVVGGQQPAPRAPPARPGAPGAPGGADRAGPHGRAPWPRSTPAGRALPARGTTPSSARRSPCTRSWCRAAAVRRPRAWASRACASARKVGTRRASDRRPAPPRGPPTTAGSRATIWCPHSVGVMHARAATMSATVSSPVWPIPVKTGLVAVGHGPRHHLGLERGEVGPRATAADHGDDVAVAPAQRRERPGDGGRRRPAPWTATLTRETRKPNPDPVSWPRKSW